MLYSARKGIALVIVVSSLAVSLVFASMVMSRSINQGYERIATVERAQLELMCLSAIEIAKLKIRAHPTELYDAFDYMHDAKAPDPSYYNIFVEDLNLEILDTWFASANPARSARVVSIERLGVTKRGTGTAAGYVEDYFRINVMARSQDQRYARGGLESEMRMNVTIQIQKTEGT